MDQLNNCCAAESGAPPKAAPRSPRPPVPPLLTPDGGLLVNSCLQTDVFTNRAEVACALDLNKQTSVYKQFINKAVYKQQRAGARARA